MVEEGEEEDEKIIIISGVGGVGDDDGDVFGGSNLGR